MATTKLERIFEKVEEQLNRHPEITAGMNCVYHFDITGEGGGLYELHLSDDHIRANQGETTQADCRIKMKEENFIKMLTGQLNGTSAYMTGKLKVKGNMGLALKLQKLFGAYNS